MMVRKFRVFIPVTLAILGMTTTWAEDAIVFQPRLFGGMGNYSLASGDFDLKVTTVDGGTIRSKGSATLDWYGNSKLQDVSPILGVGGTLGWGKFFGDIYYQSTALARSHGSDQLAATITDHPDIPDGTEYRANYGEVDFRHEDWALSLGYALTSNWSLFAGYKGGKTHWDQHLTQQLFAPATTAAFYTEIDSLDGKFEQDGPFIGVAFSYPLGGGTLTLRGAYAYLDGEYAWKGQAKSAATGEVFQRSTIKLDGNSDGYSLGMSWTKQLEDNLGLSLGAAYHWYDFDMSGSGSAGLEGSPGGISNLQFSGGTLTERLFTATASLLYTF